MGGRASRLEVGDWIHLDHTLQEWINDVVMAVFFLLVGVEIKRELVHGDLRDLHYVGHARHRRHGRDGRPGR